MSSGCVLGTISTCNWLPLRCCSASACCSSCCFCVASSVPVVSTTGESSAGMAASDCAQAGAATSSRHNASARSMTAMAVAQLSGVGAGGGVGACGAAGGGVPKSTAGASEIAASFSTVKFGFSLAPVSLAVITCGNWRM